MKLSIVFAGAIAFAASPCAMAQQSAEDSDQLEEIVVTATPLNTTELEMTRSATILSGEELRQRLNNSIGETVGNLPGVHSAYFGPGVGRPIIRGQDGPRVAVLENNISSNDVSNVSADHAVSIEPFLARQIEVLRGPATLLYGSDTIGGVVNVHTHRIPGRTDGDGVNNSITLQGNSVADERFAGVELNHRYDLNETAALGFHFDGFTRDTDDYDIPGFSDIDEDGDGDAESGTLENSALETEGFSGGFSYLGDRWEAGISVTTFDTLYGIPGAGHGHEEEDEEHDEGEEEEEEEIISIDLNQTRIDGRLVIDNPLKNIDTVKLLISNNDYEHQELEGDEIGTRFEADTLESRLEFTHTPLAGWRGVFGLQYQTRDFSALGEEAFVPPSETDQLALFVLEEKHFGDFRVELGLRLEDQEITTISGQRATHSPFSASLGTVWSFSEHLKLAANIARAQRAPSEEELFANGPHLATETFELGDAQLEEETSTSFEVSLRGERGPLSGSLTYFYNDFEDFVFLTDTGLIEDGLPVRQWEQADAELSGMEGEVALDFARSSNGYWRINAFFDTVDADLARGGNVPRTPPTRFGVGLQWNQGPWQLGVDAVEFKNQDDTAALETATPGYTLTNANLVYRINSQSGIQWEAYLRGRNLGDEEARNHTSFLKDVAPLPGRNWVLGLRASF
ncbi:MAG: TonB-dependent receptor [Lysobacterales bacterium]